ncbi:hypothetical protein LWI29_002198 [Acer saccharum]|uniref:Uncharacterized protein n=1 Tax=Acer saccharum TaxID=4024 RepID=A0AA39W5M6_ACESA|nr:hypothetical protein LWI29_002198 [Acer saccharum]
MEPLSYGKYPASMRGLVTERLPKFTKKQTRMVKGSYDFIGINYYTAIYAVDVPITNSSNISCYSDSLAILTTAVMASENYMQPSIPRFDGHCDHWSMLMENFLRSKEYWQIIEVGVAEPAENVVLTATQKTELEALKLKDLKAKNYLFQAIDRSILETILSKESSKEIWDSMKKKYQGSSRVKRAQLQALRKDFETLQMKDSESVTNYCARTMGIANKMRFHGEQMKDVAIVEKILRSLAPKYDYVVCSIEESKDIDTFSLDELQSSLLVHEQKMNRNTSSDEQALKAFTFVESSNTRGRGRGRGRGMGGRGNRDGDRQ